jgi:DNA-binding transcriptional ArsR family regulator
VSTSALEAIVEHEGRLDVLCCLIDGEWLTVPQLSARTGKSLKAVRHYVKLLKSIGLVERSGKHDGREPLYGASLDGHPDWVREAVEEHRRA